MAVPPPLDLKLMVKRSQYKRAKSERKKALISQQAQTLKRKAQHYVSAH